MIHCKWGSKCQRPHRLRKHISKQGGSRHCADRKSARNGPHMPLAKINVKSEGLCRNERNVPSGQISQIIRRQLRPWHNLLAPNPISSADTLTILRHAYFHTPHRHSCSSSLSIAPPLPPLPLPHPPCRSQLCQPFWPPSKLRTRYVDPAVTHVVLVAEQQ